jgi:hypothetical protein
MAAIQVAIWLLVAISIVAIWRNIVGRNAEDPQWPYAYVLKYLLFLRVPIALGLFLFLFPFLAATIASRFVQNLFVVVAPWQLTAVIVSVAIAALTVSISFEIILENTEARFHVPSPGNLLKIVRHNSAIVEKPFRYALATVLAAPTWIATVWFSAPEIGQVGILTGVGVGVIILILLPKLVDWAHAFFRHPSITAPLTKIFRYVLMGSWNYNTSKTKSSTQDREQLLEGFFDKDGNIVTEHLLGLALCGIGFLVYMAAIYLFQPGNSLFGLKEAPAIIYALLLIWVLTILFAAATFYADRFRIPVIIFFVLFSGFGYLVFGVDHFFRLDAIENAAIASGYPQEQQDDFKTIIDRRLHNQSDPEARTLVVVCASGGGIQAAGWTVQVLTGLQQHFGPAFTQATGFISSASGGSVGTMFLLDRFADGIAPAASQAAIFDSATSNNLDAVGWGLAYPDLVRLIGLPFLAGGRFNDRGYAIERDWQALMQHPEMQLSDWRQQILAGEVPIPVFNATLVEDGRRFLISPMKLIGGSLQELAKPRTRDRKALDFVTLFSGYDIDVTTAARLSATFPYVTPIARNDRPRDRDVNLTHNYHVTDGGYFDNTGSFTALEWLDKWLPSFRDDLNIKHVLFLEINAFPATQLNEREIGGLGWFMEWIGPLTALNSVRDSTQIARNIKEFELLKTSWQDKGVEIEPFQIFFPEGYQQPLSWKLSSLQKKNLQAAWGEIIKSPAFKNIENVWQKWDMPTEF